MVQNSDVSNFQKLIAKKKSIIELKTNNSNKGKNLMNSSISK